MPDIAELTLRIADTLRDPRESMDVELKGWLDLATREHQAVLAKAAIALANHGGGLVVLGHEQQGANVVEAPGRPLDLAAFNQDAVNGIIARYAEPVFHCDVRISHDREGREFPVVVVPGGHRFPIRSTRDGPNQNHIRHSVYYIRRPGPQSDGPQTGGEWDDLLRRCLTNGREDLLDSFRNILAGGGASTARPEQADRLAEWFAQSMARWENLIEQSPADSHVRMPLGHYAVCYSLTGDIDQPNLNRLREILNGYPQLTGWPPFWVPTRPEIAPYVNDGAIECWLGTDAGERDPAHSDFWRVSPDGLFFLIRGYQEDGTERRPPGTGFDITLPTWRIGEVLMHAAAMARGFGDPSARVTFMAEWTGLANRELVSLGDSLRWIMPGRISRQERYETRLSVDADRISENLPEFVTQIVTPIYALFDFFELPANLITEELARLRDRRG